MALQFVAEITLKQAICDILAILASAIQSVWVFWTTSERSMERNFLKDHGVAASNGLARKVQCPAHRSKRAVFCPVS